MSVTILDTEFNRIATVDDYESLSFTLGWQAPGPFEITINRSTLYSGEFQVDRYIMVDDDPYKAGVIESIEERIDQDGAGSNILTIKGRELASVLDRRTILPPAGQDYYKLTSNFENVLKTVLSAQTTGSRAFPELVITTNQNRGPTFEFSARFKNLLQSFSEAALSTGAGFFCYLDLTNKKINFDIGISADKTAEVIFSTDFETLKTARKIDNKTGFKNLALVGGQGEGKDRTLRAVYTEASEPTGLNRREWFVDARDLSTTGALDTRGAQKLEEVAFSTFIEASALEYSQAVYSLGDLAKIRQFESERTVRITAIQESWVSGRYDVRLTFDKFLPTIDSQVGQVYARGQEVQNTIEIPQDLSPDGSPTFARVITPMVDNDGNALQLNPAGGNVLVGTTVDVRGKEQLEDTAARTFQLQLRNRAGGHLGRSSYIGNWAGSELYITNNYYYDSGFFKDSTSGASNGITFANDGAINISTSPSTGDNTPPPARVTISPAGYTALGADAGAPAIKMKKLTGTTASTQGAATNIAHGLTPSKIISATLKVEYGGTGTFLPHMTYSPFSLAFYIQPGLPTDFTVENVPGASGSVLLRPFVITIWYEE
jgi:hypothetical protein